MPAARGFSVGIYAVCGAVAAGDPYGERQGVVIELQDADEQEREAARAAGWVPVAGNICNDRYAQIPGVGFEECFRVCADHRTCAEFSVLSDLSQCRFAVAADGCDAGEHDGESEMWRLPSYDAACSDVTSSEATSMCATITPSNRDVLCTVAVFATSCRKSCGLCPVVEHTTAAPAAGAAPLLALGTTTPDTTDTNESVYATGGEWLEMTDLRGRVCSAHYAEYGISASYSSKSITLEECKHACLDQRGCAMFSLAERDPDDLTPVSCRLALEGHPSCIPVDKPESWPASTMWELSYLSLLAPLSYQASPGCRSTAGGACQPHASSTGNITVLPRLPTTTAVASLLQQLGARTKDPWVYFMGDSNSRAMVEAGLTADQRNVFRNRVQPQNHLNKRDYARGEYQFGYNELISDIDVPVEGNSLSGNTTVKLTFDWNPFPTSSRFEWVIKDKFAHGKDRPDVVVIMGLGTQSCAWEPGSMQNHNWELDHMFKILDTTTLPIVFVAGGQLNLPLSNLKWTTAAEVKGCLAQFKAAWLKSASEACYPWIDVQVDSTQYEDAHIAGPTAVSLPETPYHTARIRAILEAVVTRLDCTQDEHSGAKPSRTGEEDAAKPVPISNDINHVMRVARAGGGGMRAEGCHEGNTFLGLTTDEWSFSTSGFSDIVERSVANAGSTQQQALLRAVVAKSLAGKTVHVVGIGGSHMVGAELSSPNVSYFHRLHSFWLSEIGPADFTNMAFSSATSMEFANCGFGGIECSPDHKVDLVVWEESDNDIVYGNSNTALKALINEVTKHNVAMLMLGLNPRWAATADAHDALARYRDVKFTETDTPYPSTLYEPLKPNASCFNCQSFVGGCDDIATQNGVAFVSWTSAFCPLLIALPAKEFYNEETGGSDVVMHIGINGHNQLAELALRYILGVWNQQLSTPKQVKHHLLPKEPTAKTMFASFMAQCFTLNTPRCGDTDWLEAPAVLSGELAKSEFKKVYRQDKHICWGLAEGSIGAEFVLPVPVRSESTMIQISYHASPAGNEGVFQYWLESNPGHVTTYSAGCWYNLLLPAPELFVHSGSADRTEKLHIKYEGYGCVTGVSVVDFNQSFSTAGIAEEEYTKFLGAIVRSNGTAFF